MKSTLLLPLIFLAGLGSIAAQTRSASNFQLLKISQNLIPPPQYTYSKAEQCQANQRDRWLEVEVQFSFTPEFTDELTFKYFIVSNGKLLTGEVTHGNIPAGCKNRSVIRDICGATIAGEIHGELGGFSLIQQIKYLVLSS